MGLSRHRRDGGNIWAGFVDAVTTLLMVLMFVLTIFTVSQSMLRDTITSQDTQLDALGAQLAQLADALGLERPVRRTWRVRSGRCNRRVVRPKPQATGNRR